MKRLNRMLEKVVIVVVVVIRFSLIFDFLLVCVIYEVYVFMDF